MSISALDSKVKYKEMGSYRDYYFLHNKFEDLNRFYNDCHTLVFAATTDDIDSDKIEKLYNSYNLYKDHAFSLDGTVNFEFNSYYSEQIGQSDCEKIVRSVLKNK